VTPAELDEIERRACAATEGPWTSAWTVPPDGGDERLIIGPEGEDVVGQLWYDGAHIACTEPDAAFIAAARTDVPRLVAEVRRLRGIVDEAQVVATAENISLAPRQLLLRLALAQAENRRLRAELEERSQKREPLPRWTCPLCDETFGAKGGHDCANGRTFKKGPKWEGT